MSGGALVLRRDYLVRHRRLILSRALAATAAGALPVPFLDDWLVGSILGRAFRRIADEHQIDLDDAAATTLAHGRASEASWAELASGAAALRIGGRAWKRMMVAVAAVKAARAAARTFSIMTCFDHYCARLHVGAGIDRNHALRIRDTIVRAIDTTPGGLSLEAFRRGVISAARTSAKAQLELADALSGGALRRFLDRKGVVTEAAALRDVDAALERQLAEKTSFLARAVASVELQLSADVNPYLDGLLLRFDELWRRDGASA